ncbi:MAG: polysaccharide biosynthesis tyrosine autokinase [Candidatus Neomarinimicrobiota bacterium]|nr:polysaccharide biosynthesis tyrosine autokinase [Candidatus Neomarinimicrobiota bacterium]
MDEFRQSFLKEEVPLKEILFLIKSQFSKLLISVILFLFVSIIYTIIIRPVYTSSGSIIVEEENSSMSSIFDMGLGSDMNYLANEIEVLKSRSTSERAIKSLLDSDNKNNLHLFGTKEHKDGLFRKFFRSILFLDWNKSAASNINNEINDSLFFEFVEKLRKDVSIVNLRNTDVLKVSYSSYDPYESALIVNVLIEAYRKRDQEWASGEMSHLKEFLIDQLNVKENELNYIEQELKTFQEKEHIYGLDDNSNLLLKQLTTVESDYYSTEAKKNILFERKKYFENQLNKSEKEFTKSVSNTLDVQLYSIRQELSSLEAEYISTKSREGNSHPAVIDLEKKIKNLKSILNKETEKYVKQGIAVANPIEYRQAIMDSVINFDAFISGYSSKLLELENLISKYELQLSSLPEKYLMYSRFQRDKVILDETYSLMKQKLEEAKINEASQLGKIRIVDSAIYDSEESSPNKKLILFLGICAGIVFGVAFILLREFLDSTIKSIEEIERRGLAILTIIPSIGSAESNKRKRKKGYKINLKLKNSEKIERRLLTHEDPKSPISEAYRSLRTSLMYDNKSEKGKCLLVSSPGPGEGKTTTVANLAITYANMGKKTLLIDADLRKPVLHKMFKNPHNKGLTNFLSGSENNINEILIESGVKNLQIITSGIIPPNPSELLASNYMSNFINEVKKDFDVILFDTPPLIAVTDAFVITKFIDKFLLVIRASVTQKGALERSLSNLDNMKSSIDGVIFNGVDESNTYGGGYYYNYYQYYYGNDEK